MKITEKALLFILKLDRKSRLSTLLGNVEFQHPTLHNLLIAWGFNYEFSFLHSQIKTKFYFEKKTKKQNSNIRSKNFYQNKNDIFVEQKQNKDCQ